ncbi:MAG: hypothetical protein ACP5NW_05760 [Candidatus Woesearchaeota archaeon]
MRTKKFTNKINYARMPTLETYMMVTDIIKEHSGEYNRRQLWLKLPRKVMWQTYCLLIDYLLHENYIGVDRKGVICWIYNPKLADKYLKKKNLGFKDDN